MIGLTLIVSLTVAAVVFGGPVCILWSVNGGSNLCCEPDVESCVVTVSYCSCGVVGGGMALHVALSYPFATTVCQQPLSCSLHTYVVHWALSGRRV